MVNANFRPSSRMEKWYNARLESMRASRDEWMMRRIEVVDATLPILRQIEARSPIGVSLRLDPSGACLGAWGPWGHGGILVNYRNRCQLGRNCQASNIRTFILRTI